MNYSDIMEYVNAHMEEFDEDECLSLAFLFSAMAQDKRMEKDGL